MFTLLEEEQIETIRSVEPQQFNHNNGTNLFSRTKQ